MKVESIAALLEHSARQAIIGLENQFLVCFLSGRLRYGLLYITM